MIRTAFALIAALWFAGNALWFVAPGDGEAGPAVTTAARTVFAGLAFVAFALLDWVWIQRWLDDTDRQEREARWAAERAATAASVTGTEPPAAS